MEVAYARTKTVHAPPYIPPVKHTTSPWLRELGKPVATDFPAGVMAWSILIYAIMFAALGWAFTGAAATGFVVTLALVAFMLLRRAGGGFGQFLKGQMATATGPIPGGAALVLVLVVPTCLAAAALAIGIAFRVLQ
ncbi:MAG: hypothetical protein IT535_07800 [Bauldia sp.]|nr:hypothetical protein [Bauldia sp.]